MIRPRRTALPALALAVASVLVSAGCADHDPQVVAPPLSAPTNTSAAYNPNLAPAAAVLSVVPRAATRLVVDDYDAMKLDHSLGSVTSRSPASARARVAQVIATDTVNFGDGLLADVDATLRSRYGFGQDDVAWQALWTGPDLSGWAIRLDDSVAPDGPRAAITAKIGRLVGATYYPSSHILLHDGTLDPTKSWRAEAGLRALVGQNAESTYMQRSCLPLTTVYGDAAATQVTPNVRAKLSNLDPLDAFSINYGTSLATVAFGELRDDAQYRADLVTDLPDTDPSFPVGYQNVVVDPQGGRLGYNLADRQAAARLALLQKLPFALCSSL